MTSTNDLFNQHGLRCTRQRVALYDALRQCVCHPTADELYHMVQPEAGSLSRATVYNTLEALCRAGLARQLPTTNGCCRYDANLSDHLHVRLRETSEIRDVPEELGRTLLQALPCEALAQIERTMGVKIEGVNIQFVGRSTVQEQSAKGR